MPTKWIPAPAFLRYKGVRIYLTFHNDDMDDIPNTYWYGWDPDCSVEASEDGCVFDIRELALYVEKDPFKEDHKEILRKLIDAGLLTKDGPRIPSDY